ISSLTDKFVSDPHTVVKAGDVVKVKVMEVDVERRRISLSMRLDEAIPQAGASKSPSSKGQQAPRHAKPASKPAQKSAPKQPANAAMGNAFADAFAKLKK
ncbi:MAG TPA: S1 RNA-binding domain-containing protein, partial [Pseudomonadales bacterium]|nr:S1 RNA-binding domain-containing protein [Pseudomonadales bacterium]